MASDHKLTLKAHNIATGTFNMSKIALVIPHFLPNTRCTLVAPGFLLYNFRICCLVFNLTIIVAKLTEPMTYAPNSAIRCPKISTVVAKR